MAMPCHVLACLVGMEPQGLGAAQGGQAASAADTVPQIPGDRADVGAGGAVHLDAQLPLGGIPVQQLQPVHRDGPRREIHGFTAPGPGMGPFAIHVDGGDLWWTLLNGATEGFQRGIELKIQTEVLISLQIYPPNSV